MKQKLLPAEPSRNAFKIIVRECMIMSGRGSGPGSDSFTGRLHKKLPLGIAFGVFVLRINDHEEWGHKKRRKRRNLNQPSADSWLVFLPAIVTAASNKSSSEPPY